MSWKGKRDCLRYHAALRHVAPNQGILHIHRLRLELSAAIDEEEYDKAALIRDEIK